MGGWSGGRRGEAGEERIETEEKIVEMAETTRTDKEEEVTEMSETTRTKTEVAETTKTTETPRVRPTNAEEEVVNNRITRDS
jgi:hypothetical protein